MPIISDINYASGKPVVEGTRLWIGLIVSQLEESSLEEIREDFGLEREQVMEAINYCANQNCLKNCVRYCQGCKKENPRGVKVWEIAEELKRKYFI